MSDSMRIPPSKIIEELRADLAIARDHCREYRRNWDEAKNEIASLTEERDAALSEVEHLKEKCETLLTEKISAMHAWHRYEKEVETLAKMLNEATGVRTVLKDGTEKFVFDTVTVFRREGKEGLCYNGLGNNDLWYVFGGTDFNNQRPPRRREDAEAWCVEQLRPKWRPAKKDGSDNGKACRVKGLSIEGLENWIPGTLLAYDEYTQGGPWVVRSQNGWINVSPVCEVQD